MEDKKQRIEYVRELRKKILVISIPSFILFVLIFWQSPNIINLLVNYYNLQVYNFSPSESIGISLNFAFFSTLLFFIPAMMFQLLSFSKETIKPEYSKGFLAKSSFGFVLALVGFFLGSTLFTKIVLEGLSSYNLGVAMWSVASVLKTAIVFGSAIALSFQMIWFIPVITNIELIKKRDLSKARLFIIVGLLIVSALITPPDMLSQLMMMIPLYGSFETGLLLSKNKMEEKQC